VPHRMGNIPMLSPQLDRLTEYGPMECIAMDTIGPITMSNGQTTIIHTMVDLYTRWGQAYALRQQKTRNIAETFVMKWVCMHGFPRTIVSDNGPGFSSKVMKEAMALLGVKIHFSLPYRPQSNGVCERMNATIKNMLSSYTQTSQSNWANYLPFIVFAYNTSVHSSTGFTPFRLLCGREAVIGSEAALRVRDAREVADYPTYIQRMRQDMSTSDHLIGQRVRQAADIREAVNDQYRTVTQYEVGEHVFVYWPPTSSKKDKRSRKLMSPYRGPFTVTLQFNAVSYQVREDNTGKTVSVHVSRMKKAVERNAELIASDRDLALNIQDEPAERDNGVHEFTRAQRLQRAHQPNDEQDMEAAATVDDELEEGEVPPALIQQQGAANKHRN
jgi:hypothetical protein